MYYFLFRWFPKRQFSRLMGRLACVTWPRWLLTPLIRLTITVYRIDMEQFEGTAGDFATFSAFFTRPLRAGARPIAPAHDALVSPVDGTVIDCRPVREGRLFQAKGKEYSLSELLGGEPGWEAYDGGSALSLYLSPRDYHRIHSPCGGAVTRFCYLPGDLWTVSPLGVRGVPRLFVRNERLVTFIATAFGEAALVAVGATVVGKIRVVYHSQTSNQPGARPRSARIDPPYSLERGAELGRFELGSTVILLFRPDEVRLHPLRPGQPVRMGQAIGTVRPEAA